MDIPISFIHIATILYNIDSFKGDVTIGSSNVTVNNTDDLSKAFVAVFTEENEIDDIKFEWDPPTRTPSFDFYYSSERTDGAGSIIRTIKWQKDSTFAQNKEASGKAVSKAVLGTNTVTSKIFFITVQWAPTSANITPTGALTILLGNELKLTCSSPDKGYPAGTVVWTQGANIQAEYTNNVLTIESTKRTESGMWKCSYKNDLDTSTYSPSVNVTVIYPASDVKLTLSNPGPFEKGDTLDMTCMNSDQGNPVANLLFKLDDMPIANLEQINSSKGRISSISNEHNGLLKCCYNNDAGEACSDTQNLLVQSKPGKPQIFTLSQTTLLKGQTLSLKCSLESDKGFPEASKVIWTLNGSVVDTHRNESLKVANITEEHTGEWVCYYSNIVGSGPPSDAVRVSLGWLPSKTNLTSNSFAGFITLNTSLILTCLIQDKGNPPGLVKWKKDFNVYDSHDAILTIDNVLHNDSGIWDCFYQNRFGNGSFDRNYITVIWDVSNDGLIKIEAENNDIREGDDVTLEYVLADRGSPEARVTWTHNTTVKGGENNYTLILEDVTFSDSGQYGCFANNSFSRSNVAVKTLIVKPRQEMQVWIYIVIAVCCGILLIVIIVIIICCVKKKKRQDKKSDSIGYANRSLQPDNMTGTGPANKPNVEAAAPVYAAVSRGKVLAPIAAGADGSVYSHVDLSKKTARQSLKGLPMSKKAIDRIIFHKKDGYVNMTFQVRKKFIGDIEIGVCRIGDQSCTSKVSKQHDGASKDVVMVLPIEDTSPDSYSIRIKFTERGQVTQTVDLTYPYNKNAVNVTVLNDAHGTNVSPSFADVEVEGVPSRPPRQGYPAEGVTYAVMDWDRSQAPGRPPRLSSRSPAQEHVVYADVRPGGNVN